MENNLAIAWLAPIITGLILTFILNFIGFKQNISEEKAQPVGYDMYKEFMLNPKEYKDEKVILELKSVWPGYEMAPQYVCTGLGLKFGDTIVINVSVADNDSKYKENEIISLYALESDSKYFDEIAKGDSMKIEVQLKYFHSNSYEENGGSCRRLLFLGMEDN